ncbi:MAG: VanW family protein [Candidatus Fervidibacter sp.]|uniref:VanW family protein n=3 Tax=Candidatus Fervidibacter sp. TaxID=3100871 RepID=UPI00404B34BC
MCRWFLVGVAMSFALVMVGGGLGLRWWQNTDRIAFGVRVQGVNVGGLKSSDAIQALERSLPAFEDITVPLVCEGRVVRKVKLEWLKLKPNYENAVKMALRVGRQKSTLDSLREFSLAWQGRVNLPLPFVLDEEKALSLLKQLSQSLDRPPQRAFVKLNGRSTSVVPSRDGVVVDIEGTLRLWGEQLREGKWEALPIAMKTVRPEVTTEDVAEIDGIVGQATTYFRASERNRTHNIRLAASRLDHVLVRPNGIISFNELVGPRTLRHGFKIARVIIRGKFTEDFGGGVCQVAGTLYLAALRVGMEVLQRQRHSRPVGYLPIGLDATVDFGSLDLKLRNPFSTPLYIRTFVKGGKLTVLVLGKRQPNKSYRIVRVVKRENFSRSSGALKPEDKEGMGYRVTVFRLLVENGVTLRRELISADTYLLPIKLRAAGSNYGTESENVTQQPFPVQVGNDTSIR